MSCSNAKKRRSSGGSSRVDAAILTSLEDINQKLTAAAKSTREEKANKGVTLTNISYSTRDILDLVRAKGIERKALMHRGNNGLTVLFNCLKENINNSIVTDVLLIFQCLSDHKYKARMVRQGAIDQLLESLSLYAKSSICHDEQLVIYLKLLLQLSFKDSKFATKCRLFNTIPVITSLLKRNLKNSHSLSVILSVVKTLSINTTNALSFGQHGIMNCYPRLLSLYGLNTDYTILKYVIKSLGTLLKQKANIRKRSCVSELIGIYEKLHISDVHGRHIALRKSVILTLATTTSIDSSIQAFYKSNGLPILYRIARELHESTKHELHSLSSLTCSVIRKCLPKCPLPLTSLESPVLFPLVTMTTIRRQRCRSAEPRISRRSSSRTSLVTKSPSNDSLGTTSEPSLILNEEVVEGGQPPKRIVSMETRPSQERIQSPLSYFISFDDTRRNFTRSSNLSYFDQFFPESSFLNWPISRSVSLPVMSSFAKATSEPIQTSRSTPTVDTTRQLKDTLLQQGVTNPRMIISDYVDESELPRENVLFSEDSTAKYETQYKKVPSTERDILFADARRILEPDDLIYETVYSIDDLISCDTSSSDQHTPTKVKVLRFRSTSESSNLRKAIQIREYEYDLILNPDLNTNHHHQWFLFEVSNMEIKKPYRFNIINCEKPNSQFNHGMQPLMYSSITQTWSRVGTNISYYKNNFYHKKTMTETMTNGDTDGMEGHSSDSASSSNTKRFYTVTFTITFATQGDVIYLSYHYPYTYSMLQADLLSLELPLLTMDGLSHIYYRCQTLCYTLSGNKCHLMTITNRRRTTLNKRRDYIILTARVHPGESNSSWTMKGVLKFLMSGETEADKLRDHFIFKIIPMLNPDGVINGNHRCSLSGHDLNRQWISPDPSLHPTIYGTKGLMEWITRKRNRIHMFCDFHGHSRKKNVFMYGCRDPLKSQVEEELPRILNKMAPLFSISDCNYVVDKSKEGTGRVAVWRRFNLKRSYTMESTYCGSDQGPLQGKQVNTQDLQEMGRWFCIGLLCTIEPNSLTRPLSPLLPSPPVPPPSSSSATASNTNSTMTNDISQDEEEDTNSDEEDEIDSCNSNEDTNSEEEL